MDDMNMTKVHEVLNFLQNDLSNTNTFFALLIIGVGFVGIVGNILNMIVLSRRKMRSNTINFLLLCLAFWDIVAIIGILIALEACTIFKNFLIKDESDSVKLQRMGRFLMYGYLLGETGNFT